ncbi:hypothetical protein O3P69_002213 [Scylla paramamosain]|uniref:Uncharacterized protein n=1 Tax=Scylla paramamosain TaxID=85552 RepID=A0AAW0V7E7_SCYPA
MFGGAWVPLKVTPPHPDVTPAEGADEMSFSGKRPSDLVVVVVVVEVGPSAAAFLQGFVPPLHGLPAVFIQKKQNLPIIVMMKKAGQGHHDYGQYLRSDVLRGEARVEGGALSPPRPPLFSPHRDDLIPWRRRPTGEADTTIKTTTTIITFASYI